MDEEIAAGSEDSGEYATDGSQTLSAAAELMANWPDDDESGDQAQPTKDDREEGATKSEDESDDEGADGQPDESEAAAEDQPEEDPGIDWDKVPGTAKFNLRDGTSVTAADLKRRWDDLRGVRQAQEEFQSQRQEFTNWALQQAQQAQVLEKLLPTAVQALQAQLPEIPPLPDFKLVESDPIGYIEQRAKYDAAVEEYRAKQSQIDQLRQAQQQQSQQHKAEYDQRVQGFIAQERERLLEAMPDLRDKAKREEFGKEFVEIGGGYYGFSNEELSQVHDHRLIRMARDAIAYRKLKSNPPKATPAPAAKAAPVAQPGRRQVPGEVETVKRNELVKRVQQRGGKVHEVAKLMEDI